MCFFGGFLHMLFQIACTKVNHVEKITQLCLNHWKKILDVRTQFNKWLIKYFWVCFKLKIFSTCCAYKRVKNWIEKDSYCSKKWVSKFGDWDDVTQHFVQSKSYLKKKNHSIIEIFLCCTKWCLFRAVRKFMGWIGV